eukprot:TRINITY_DN3371_c0_g1_i4.p1 TRINITY_DN3371_c0_g1~~TRINITY_DN3371_c0_g1_i4.p1  ORF type:complete len:139 (+),score=20.30 TRINITY_DN3371_c0_g1_i4:114-530(+)
MMMRRNGKEKVLFCLSCAPFLVHILFLNLYADNPDNENRKISFVRYFLTRRPKSKDNPPTKMRFYSFVVFYVLLAYDDATSIGFSLLFCSPYRTPSHALQEASQHFPAGQAQTNSTAWKLSTICSSTTLCTKTKQCRE